MFPMDLEKMLNAAQNKKLEVDKKPKVSEKQNVVHKPKVQPLPFALSSESNKNIPTNTAEIQKLLANLYR